METLPPKGQAVETSLIRSTDNNRDAHAPLVLQLGSSDQNASGGITFGLLWKSLTQRLLVTIPLGIILGAAAGAALWYFTQDKYMSTATLMILDKKPFLAFDIKDQSHAFSQTQVELLRDPYTIGQAIETANLLDLPEISLIKNEQDPVLWIAQRLKVQRVGKSELYKVSFVTREANSAQKVVDAIVKVYTKFQEKQDDSQRQRVLELLKDEHTAREADIEKKREKLRSMVLLAGGETAAPANAAGGAMAAAAIGRADVLATLQQKLIDAQVDIELKGTDVLFLRERAEKSITISEEHVAAAIATDPEVRTLTYKLEQLKNKTAALKPNSVGRQNAEKEVEQIDRRLSERKEELRVETAKKLEDTIATQRKDLVAKVEADLENQRRFAGLIREKLHGELEQRTNHGDKSLEVEFARNELQRAEAVSRLISDRMVHLSTESRALSPVKIVADPTLPRFPDGPSLAKKLAMVGMAGFLVPFALFMGWDLLYRRVYEREQLQREMKVKFVSEVAALPIRSLLPRPGSGKDFKQQSLLFEESVNSLRTTLSVDKALDGCRVFVMASAVSGEGKTNLSSQLAMSWSQAEPGKVILVDADLRSPNVHDLFEVPPGPGLAEVLRGECSLEDATIMDWGDRLYILPAGNLGTDSASQLFSGPAFLEVVAKLRSQYSKVMIDVPPVLCASETLLIAKHADGVLMCALHDYSRTGQIKLAYDRLAVAGVTVVGAVLNGAPVRQYSYAYRGYGAN